MPSRSLVLLDFYVFSHPYFLLQLSTTLFPLFHDFILFSFSMNSFSIIFLFIASLHIGLFLETTPLLLILVEGKTSRRSLPSLLCYVIVRIML